MEAELKWILGTLVALSLVGAAISSTAVVAASTGAVLVIVGMCVGSRISR